MKTRLTPKIYFTFGTRSVVLGDQEMSFDFERHEIFIKYANAVNLMSSSEIYSVCELKEFREIVTLSHTLPASITNIQMGSMLSTKDGKNF